jgi:hypothetical protein
MKGVFLKEMSSLRPFDQAARDILAKYKLGDLVAVDVVKPRCIGHHRLYWALCQLVAENMDGDFSAEVVSDVLKIRSGHVTMVRTRKGGVFIPKSISFAAMDQLAFSEFFDRALRVVVSDILPGIDSATLRAEVESIVGGR